MRQLVVLFGLIAISSTAFPQVYFPLHVGDWWAYEDHSSLRCEGTSIIYDIVDDTVLNGRMYARFRHSSPFSGPLVRADSIRVYEYDTVAHTEYVVFDFSVKPGDTVSVRENGGEVTTALGWMKFSVVGTTYRVTYTILDSIGVVTQYDAVSMCSFSLTGALINGRRLYSGVPSDDKQFPESAFLDQNYPNPFNPVTKIQFSIVNRQLTIVKVYDALGREVATLVSDVKEPGTHTVQFDGSGLASGVYFYQLRSGPFVQTRKLLLLR